MKVTVKCLVKSTTTRFKALGFKALGFKALGFKALGFKALGFKALGSKALRCQASARLSLRRRFSAALRCAWTYCLSFMPKHKKDKPSQQRPSGDPNRGTLNAQGSPSNTGPCPQGGGAVAHPALPQPPNPPAREGSSDPSREDNRQHTSAGPVTDLPAPAASSPTNAPAVGDATPSDQDATRPPTTTAPPHTPAADASCRHDSDRSSSSASSSSTPLSPSFKHIPGLSYAQALGFRRARTSASTDGTTSDSALTEFELDISQHITLPPRSFKAGYKIIPFFAAVKKPTRSAGATYSNLVLDPTDRFHTELGVHINRTFPTDIGKQSWQLGLSLALDPCHLEDDVIAKVYPTIFSLSFVCPLDSVNPEPVEALVTSMVTSDPRPCLITYRATEKNKSTFITTALSSLVAFGRSPADLYAFAARPTDVSFVLSISFPFNCPDEVRDNKLMELGAILYSRTLTPKEIATVFEKCFTLPPEETGGFPRATNSFRAKFGFHKTADQEAIHLFTQLCLFHLRYRKKLLDCEVQKHLRISSLSFSFYTDKNPRRTTPYPAWLVEVANGLEKTHSDLFAAEKPDRDDASQAKGASTPLAPASPTATASQAKGATPLAAASPTATAASALAPAVNASTTTTPSASLHSSSPDLCSEASPPVIETHAYSVHIESPEDMASCTSISFTLEDFGQYLEVNNADGPKRLGNCCIFLSLAASLTSVSPLQLAAYFETKAHCLQQDNRLYDQHKALQKQWRKFTKHRLDLFSSFPSAANGEWAGSYLTGQPVDFAHLSLLSPSEVRASPIIIVRDCSHLTELRISREALGNHIAYLPANTPDASPPIFLRHKAQHFTLLRPSDGASAAHILATIASMLPPQCVFPYINDHDRPDNLMAHLVNVTTACKLNGPASLLATHDLRMKAVSDSFASHSSRDAARNPPAHESSPSAHCDNDPARPTNANDSDDEATDLLRRPQRTASCGDEDDVPSSPEKAPNLQSTPPRLRYGNTPSSPSIEQQASQLSIHTPSYGTSTQASTASDLNADCSSTSAVSSISDLSNVDLARYVAMQGRAGESEYAARVGVVGYCSSDTTSQATPVSWRSDVSSSVSRAPSLYSNGSLHSHAIPSHHDVPRCRCLRSMRFFCFHEDNHNCDGAQCADPRIRLRSYGWHCADCNIDLCTTCFPIDFTPENSFVDSQSQSSLSIPDTPPSDAAPRSQVGADAAASGRGHNA